MSRMYGTAIVLCLVTQMAFSVNPLESILTVAVDRVLQGLDRRLAAQASQQESRLTEMEARLADHATRLETRLQVLVDHSGTIETQLTEHTVALETRLAQQKVAITSYLTGAIDAKFASLKANLDEATDDFYNKVDAFQEKVVNDIKLTLNYTEHRNQDDLGRINTTVYEVVNSLERLKEQSMAMQTRLTEQTNALETSLAQQKGAITSAIDEKYVSLTETVEESIMNGTYHITTKIQEIMENGTKDFGVKCEHSFREKVTKLISLASNYSEQPAQYTLVQVNNTVSGLVNGVEERLVTEMENLANGLGERLTNETRAALTAIEHRLQENLAQSNITTQNLERSLKNILRGDSQDARELVTETYTNLSAQILELLSIEPIVFLRRVDGSVNFTRPWADYKAGFGDRGAEFWLGLDTLHALTTQRQYKLRVELTPWSGKRTWEVHSHFSVGGEGDKYRLSVSGYDSSVSTTRADRLHSYNNGQQFTTIDNDNDGSSSVNCAMRDKGGWWYGRSAYGGCGYTNPTGLYQSARYSGYSQFDGGIKWQAAYGDWRPFKELTLKLIPV